MESTIKIGNPPLWFDPYASVRTDLYVLLASLLGRPPSEELQKVLQSLDWNEAIPDRLSQALQALSQAGHHYPLAALEEEYDKLFVGLGSGEMLPYASWYKERRIQSKPLASVRSDLIRLGIVRQTESHEPEDHAAALCEVMALISQKSMEVPLTTQADFFQRTYLLVDAEFIPGPSVVPKGPDSINRSAFSEVVFWNQRLIFWNLIALISRIGPIFEKGGMKNEN